MLAERGGKIRKEAKRRDLKPGSDKISSVVADDLYRHDGPHAMHSHSPNIVVGQAAQALPTEQDRVSSSQQPLGQLG